MSWYTFGTQKLILKVVQMDIQDICNYVRGLARIEASDSDLLSQWHGISTAVIIQAHRIKGELTQYVFLWFI